ncbi:MAG: anaerobic carbon-monoxide dehydrogenase catalytic subunit [Spirochaetaceae bacterium]|nr:anaerobic carbon-monoxide dehydrogenase catalytic subunit [Spirochaetaceae bacterium]
MDQKYSDKATQKMIKYAAEENLTTVWDRFEAMQPQCGFGKLGLCCRHCSMGPCRIDPFGDGPQTGVCGADADTITARHLTRMIAGGAAAHSDHGRGVVHTLQLAAEDMGSAYQIKDEKKLKAVAEIYGIKTENRKAKDIASDLVSEVKKEFGQQDGTIRFVTTAPEVRKQLWEKLGITPRSIDREVVETLHRTTMGVDAEYRHIIKQGMRTALADGWGGSMVATELQDVLFGVPNPLKSSANFGVMDEDKVNILVHGHEPALSDIIAEISLSEEMQKKAVDAGSKGVNVAGICCTANEILMRHGIPIAGSFLQQELAVMTGVADIMIVDIQCVMPGLKAVSDCFHTKLVTTSSKAKIPGVHHVEFHEKDAEKTAREIIEMGIENYSNRKAEDVFLPSEKEPLIAGFTAESVYDFLGGTYRATYRPLNNAIIEGRLRGAAGVIGCSNPNVDYEKGHIQMVKELLKNDVLVVVTGCNAISCAKHGLLQPESAFKYAGKGLQEICRAVGIPPVLHMGSCVDNSRILRVLSNIVAEGGLGNDICDLPAAGAAPEWMSEKAVAIGFYFVASGVYTMIGKPLPIMGSENLYNYLTDEIEQETGGKWAFEEDPIEAAHKMIRHIDKKRKNLKLKPLVYEQPFPVED